MDRLDGIYPATLTTFKQDGSLALDSFANLLERFCRAGVQGVYVGGNSGEWYLQTLEERKAVARAAVEAMRGRGKVILHVGCFRTEEAIELARYAAKIGVDGIASLPPYVARWTRQEVVQYFASIATATDLPFFVYYFPVLTGSTLDEAAFDAMKGIPQVAGCKFTDMNLSDLHKMVAGWGRDFIAFNGHDQVLLPALIMGARGGIGSFYNVIPDKIMSVYSSFKSGDLKSARAAQDEINRIIYAVRKYRLVPALRFMLELQNLNPGPSRAPTLPLDQLERSKLELELVELGFPSPVAV